MNLVALFSAIILLVYPFAVYYGLNKFGVTTVAALLIILFILRVIGGNQARLDEFKHIAWLSGSAGLILAILALFFKSSHWFTYYPVIINSLMLVIFAHSLFQDKTIIERFARLQDPCLPEYAVIYTRIVTKVWCLFFVVNACVALVTTFISLHVWTLYNGLISYLLAGGLFTIEFIVRIFIKRKNEKIT